MVSKVVREEMRQKHEIREEKENAWMVKSRKFELDDGRNLKPRDEGTLKS